MGRSRGNVRVMTDEARQRKPEARVHVERAAAKEGENLPKGHVCMANRHRPQCGEGQRGRGGGESEWRRANRDIRDMCNVND